MLTKIGGAGQNSRMEILLRKDAIVRGVSKYFTGKPCGKGHVAPRYTKTGVCCRCNVESARAFNQRIEIKAAVKRGDLISYRLASDADFDAAWAYCQALDLARGAVPQPNPRAPAVSPEAPVGADVVAEIRARRLREFGPAADGVTPAGNVSLDGGMAAQLGSLLK